MDTHPVVAVVEIDGVGHRGVAAEYGRQRHTLASKAIEPPTWS